MRSHTHLAGGAILVAAAATALWVSTSMNSEPALRPLALESASPTRAADDLAPTGAAEAKISDSVAVDRRRIADPARAAFAPWSGRVEDARTGAPVADATIGVKRGESQAECASLADGTFTLDLERGPGALLHVSHPGYVDLREAEPDLAGGRVLRLLASGSLQGLVRGAGARAREGLTVALWPSNGQRFDGPPLVRTTPGDDGAFRFDDLAPGTYGIGAVGGAGPLVFQDGVLVEPPNTAFVTLTIEPGWTLPGRVVVGAGLQPVEGALITVLPEIQGINDAIERLSQQTIESDRDGRFEVVGLAQGGLDVVVRSPWGAQRRVREDISIDSRLRERLYVFPAPARMTGIVREPGGAPASAIVGALGESDVQRGVRQVLEVLRGGASDGLDRIAHTRTDADGRFVLDRVPSGAGKLWVFALPTGDHEGLAATSQRLGEASPEQSIDDVELTLRATTPVAGRVVDSGGQPMAGVTVQLMVQVLAQRRMMDERTTDAEGRFAFEAVAFAGAGLVAVADGHHGTWYGLAKHRVGEPVELVLRPAAALSGRVVDTAGAALEGVLVSLRRGKRGSRSSRTDAFGRFVVERLAAGQYDVNVMGAGLVLSGAKKLTVTIPAEDELVLVLERVDRADPVSLGGDAIDAVSGGSVPNLRLGGIGNGLVHIDGLRFEVQGMQPARVSIALQAAGYETLVIEEREYLPGAHVELGSYEMWPAGQLRARISDARGRPVRRASVRLLALPYEEGGVGAGRAPIAVPERRRERSWPYQHREVPRRTFVLEVRRKGFKPYRETVTIGRVESLQVTLERG